MSEITTAAELDALPVNALVTDDGQFFWWKTAQGGWRAVSDTGISSSRLLQVWGPLTLSQLPESHMTRCSGGECVNAAPLLSGSSWLCADHQQHITLGGTS